MTPCADERALDNPVWSSLASRHAPYAHGGTLALRYRAEFSPLCALAAAEAANLEALRTLARVGEDIAMFVPHAPDITSHWQVLDRLRVVQLIRRGTHELPRDARRVDAISPLAATDVDDMLALVALTRPGPFCARTIELGAFVGIRREGRLVAMAGERMWVGNHREVSGVCAHPDAQRNGYSRALMSHVINWMLRAGQTPFLHVERGNAGAIALYESLGFTRRAEFAVVVARRLA